MHCQGSELKAIMTFYWSQCQEPGSCHSTATYVEATSSWGRNSRLHAPFSVAYNALLTCINCSHVSVTPFTSQGHCQVWCNFVNSSQIWTKPPSSGVYLALMQANLFPGEEDIDNWLFADGTLSAVLTYQVSPNNSLMKGFLFKIMSKYQTRIETYHQAWRLLASYRVFLKRALRINSTQHQPSTVQQCSMRRHICYVNP